MKASKVHSMNAEDRLISRMTLTFLVMPLILLTLAALTMAA